MDDESSDNDYSTEVSIILRPMFDSRGIIAKAMVSHGSFGKAKRLVAANRSRRLGRPNRRESSW